MRTNVWFTSGQSTLLRSVGIVLGAVILFTSLAKPAASDSHHLYLPFLTFHRPAPPAAELSIEETAFLGRTTEALAAQVNHVYLGAGDVIVTYDVSEPGNAQRLGESEPVWGRIIRVEAGHGVLFVLSRPQFDRSVFLPPEALPPWNELTIFDIADPSTPRKLETIRFDSPLLYAIDMTVSERYAYLLMSLSSDRDWFEFDRPPGIWTVDASDLESVTVTQTVDNETMAALRLTAIGKWLHVHAYRVAEDILPDGRDYRSGVLTFDVSDPLSPRIHAFTGHPYFDDLSRPHTIAAEHNRVYRITERSTGYVLTTEITPEGSSRLMGIRESAEQGVQLPELIPELHNHDIYNAWHAVAGPDQHLFVLEAEAYLARVSALDMSDPLDARLGWHLDLPDLRGEQTRVQTYEPDWPGDLGMGMVGLDERLFIAAGVAAGLIEIDTSQFSTPDEFAWTWYPERFGQGGCTVMSSRRLFHLHHGLRDIDILDFSESGGAMRTKLAAPAHGSGCAIAVDDNRVFASAAQGLQVFTLRDSLELEPQGSVDVRGPIRDIVLDGNRAYIAVENVGIVVTDVSDIRSPSILETVELDGGVNRLVSDGEILYGLNTANLLYTFDMDDLERSNSAPRLDLRGTVADIQVGAEHIYIIVRHEVGSRWRETEYDFELVTLTTGMTPQVHHRLFVGETTAAPSSALAIDPMRERLFLGNAQADIRLHAFDLSGSVPQRMGSSSASGVIRQLFFEDEYVIGLTDRGLTFMSIE